MGFVSSNVDGDRVLAEDKRGEETVFWKRRQEHTEWAERGIGVLQLGWPWAYENARLNPFWDRKKTYIYTVWIRKKNEKKKSIKETRTLITIYLSL